MAGWKRYGIVAAKILEFAIKMNWLKLMGKHLPKDIKAMARSHTKNALNVLCGIMNATTVSASARVAAATAILERGWGRPSQAIELSGELATKVIRSPQVIDNVIQWSETYVPEQHRTEH